MKPGATASPRASTIVRAFFSIECTDSNDTIVFDAYVGLDTRSASAVVNGAVSDKNVELVLFRLRREEGRNNH